MLLDVTLGTNDLERGIRFYDAVMATLGFVRLQGGAAGWAGWGKDANSEYGLWLCPPFDGLPASVGNGTMLTFAAASAAEVRAFHRVALHVQGHLAAGDLHTDQFFLCAVLCDLP